MDSNSGSSTLPSNKSTSISMLRQNLDKKADEKWVEAELKSIDEKADEAKTIALSSKQDWGKIKLGGVILAVSLIIAGIGQYFALKDSVEDNQDEIADIQEDVSQVKTDVTKVRTDVQTVKGIVEAEKKQQVKTDKDQLDAIKAAIKEAMPVKADIKPRRNR